MDAKTFEDEVFRKLTPSSLGSKMERWKDYKTQSLAAQRIMPTQSPDYLLLQAVMTSSAALETELNHFVPGFTNRLEVYQKLQAQLILDLITMQKLIQQNISYFRGYL